MDSTDIQELCRAEAFDHPTGEFTVRETHISWVILSGDYAYKLKKPVNFGFLDFSTLAQREHFCREELRLNRRFSPELYLDVVPVTRGDDGLIMGGDGSAIFWWKLGKVCHNVRHVAADAVEFRCKSGLEVINEISLCPV